MLDEAKKFSSDTICRFFCIDCCELQCALYVCHACKHGCMSIVNIRGGSRIIKRWWGSILPITLNVPLCKRQISIITERTKVRLLYIHAQHQGQTQDNYKGGVVIRTIL